MYIHSFSGMGLSPLVSGSAIDKQIEMKFTVDSETNSATQHTVDTHTKRRIHFVNHTTLFVLINTN